MDFISDFNSYEVSDTSFQHDAGSDQKTGFAHKQDSNIDFLNNYKNMTMSKILGSSNLISTSNISSSNKDEQLSTKKNLNSKIDELISRNLKKINLNISTPDIQNAQDSVEKENNFSIPLLKEKDKITDEVSDIKLKLNSFAHTLDNSDSLTQFQKGANIVDDLLKEQEDSLPKEVRFLFKDTSSLLQNSLYGKISREFLQLENNRLQIKKIETFLKKYSRVDEIVNTSVKKMESFKELNREITEYQSTLINNSDLQKTYSQIKEIQNDKLQLTVLKHLSKLFTLSPLEEHILHNETFDNEETLEIIEKLQKIKQRCLSMSNCTNLLKKIDSDLNYGLRKLYNNLITTLNATDLNDIIIQRRNHKSIEQFQKKIFYLSDNDLELYQNFITKFVDIEYKKITSSFLQQFDLSSKNNNNPIYLNIDDPTRYLGDVLAYVHSLIFSEYEFIECLFVSDNTSKMGKLFEDIDIKLLNDIFSKFNNLVKIRLEQVIKFEDDSSLLIQFVQLLSFYKMMFLKSKLDKDNLLIKLLDNLLHYCDDFIISSTEKYLNDKLNYKKEVTLSVSDLQPPQWLFQYLQRLSVILSNFDDFKTLEYFDSVFFKKFDKVLIENPLSKQLVDQINSTYPSKLTSKDLNIKIASLILKCNCFDLINSRLLLPFKHTFFQDEYNERAVYDELTSNFTACIDSLKEITLKILFKNLEIYDYYNLLNMIFPISEVKSELDYDMYYSIIDSPIITVDAIEKAVKLNFEEQLPLLMTNLDSQLLLTLISSPLISNEILNDSFKKFFKFYKTFHNILKRIFPNDLERLDNIFKYTDDEVYTILGLENYMDEDIYIEKEES